MSLKQFRAGKGIAAVIGGVILTLSGLSVWADTPLPVIPQAKAGATHCVEDTAVMRKEHFSFILHKRDETVYKGVRTSTHSFNECIACHVQPRSDGTYPNYDEPDHFCSTCHEYTSVKIDCFDCHVDKIVEGGAGQ